VNQERTHEEIIKNMHYPTFSDRSNDLTSTQTRIVSLWNTFRPQWRSCKKRRCRNKKVCGRFYVLRATHSCCVCVYSQI